MAVKLFVLGLPGSGKSTTARFIEMLARDYHWIPGRFNDYDILYEMYLADTEGKRFSKAEYDGFDIHEHIVFDEALIEIEKRVSQRCMIAGDKDELIIIEFARKDYCDALGLFSPPFLQDAFFLFLNTDIPTCRERIKYRSEHPETPDDHYVSEYIFESYYQNDDRQYQASVISKLNACCDINEDGVMVIDNPSTTSVQCCLENIKPWIIAILQKQKLCPESSAIIVSDPSEV
jgi:AAA domain